MPLYVCYTMVQKKSKMTKKPNQWGPALTQCLLHLIAYLAPLPTNPPECSHRVWSKNGREGCPGMLHYVITQVVCCWSGCCYFVMVNVIVASIFIVVVVVLCGTLFFPFVVFVVVLPAICHHRCHRNRLIYLFVPADTKLVSSSPAATCRPSQPSSGEMLEGENDLLFCIAVEFYDPRSPDVGNLALQLLEDEVECNEGGSRYMESKRAEIQSRDPALLAWEILKDWVRERPTEATKTRLYEALEKVNHGIARRFQSVLTSKLELLEQITNLLSREKRAQVLLL